MKNYSVYIAPAILTEIETSKNKSGIGRKVIKKLLPNSSKHWERVGTIQSKNKQTALKWLKSNKDLGNDFVYVLKQPLTV